MWYDIQRLSFDTPGAEFTFAERLARDHLWSQKFADRTIEEYRRFLYLAATADEMVTPSDFVDEVWHLHLSYTRSYWDDLCGAVLKRPLHHDPTSGGKVADQVYRNAYAYTLDQYRTVFGYSPPKDIWPPEDDRFDIGCGFRSLRRRDWFVLRRFWPRFLERVAYVAGLFGFVGSVLAVTMVSLPTFGVLVAVAASGIIYIGMTDWLFGLDIRRRLGGEVSVSSVGGGCGGCGGWRG
jgi:hypothetical protein